MEQTAADKAALKHLEPVEPDFIRQNAETMNEGERAAWFVATADELRAQGASHLRYSYADDVADVPLALVEGWKKDTPNMGEPRWQLVLKD